MKKVNLIFAVHNHQPVGNFDAVFEEAFAKAYQPFFNCHAKHPEIPIVQHYSGILLEWIKSNKPEFYQQLQLAVKQKNVELLSGGFYEPILPAIPEPDQLAQIQKMNDFLQDEFACQPQGMWLAERVWEPTLPHTLVKAGLHFTVTDDAHFKYAGLEEHQLHGYYTTEHNGAVADIFPINEKLRYLIPFKPASYTIDYLRTLATEEGDNLVVFADDGEKFGVWPDTFAQCYTNGWLDEFFTLLEQNSDWIHVITFEQALATLPPMGRIYLPTASYREMMQWALPVQAQHNYINFTEFLETIHLDERHKVFVRGGFWRNFLAKYDEANNMHKRMLRTSQRFQQHPQKDALAHLLAGQCNCAYWHGVFGGLYLPHLRSAIYQQLIQAENLLDAANAKGFCRTEFVDFDADGLDEAIVETDRMNLFFSLQNGGSLFEHDYKPKAFNVLNTMTRREETYHAKLHYSQNHLVDGAQVQAKSAEKVLVKECGLEQYLKYDWYRRASFIDHFLRDTTTLEQFANAQYGEQGDFVNQPYTVINENPLTLQRNGNVWVQDEFLPVCIQKKFVVKPKSDQLQVEYIVKNLHTSNLSLWFAVENVFSLLAGDAPDRYFSMGGEKLSPANLASKGELLDVTEISLTDEWLGISIELTLSQQAKLWRFPIETVSLSEAGFERVFQASVLLPSWQINLEPQQEWKVNITQNFKQVKI